MTDLTRVVIVAPQRTVEMALPSLVPLADLLPVLVQRATTPTAPDPSGRSRALTGDGDWALQRLGDLALDEDLSPAALQIRDGETLYLRPRGVLLPPVHFDDLVDGLATGVRGRPDRWTDAMTRAMFLGIAAVALISCLVVVGAAGGTSGGLAAAGVAALAVTGAALCSRALGDGWAALTLGVAAPPFAALAGHALFPDLPGDSTRLAAVLSSAVAAGVAAVFVIVLVNHHRAAFLGVLIVCAAAVTLALLVLIGLSIGQAAAVIVVAALLVSVLAPSLAFRLALLRLPQLPTSAADLAEDIEPYPGPRIISGATVADTYLTWMLVAVGFITTTGVIVLARTDGWAPASFAASVIAIFALRSRALTSGWQRGAALLPAVAGAATLLTRLGEDGADVLAPVAGLVGAAVGLIALSRAMPGRRLLPYWGRIADIAEYLVAIAMVLLLLQILDVYQWARALAG